MQIDGRYLYWLQSRADEGGRTSLWRRLLCGRSSRLRSLPHPPTCVIECMSTAAASITSAVAPWSTQNSQTAGCTRSRAKRCHDRSRQQAPTDSATFGSIPLAAWCSLSAKIIPGEGEPTNTIVALDLDGPYAGCRAVLCSGADFYSTPELHPRRLAWTEWNHPNMPWDSTTIMVGELSGTMITSSQAIAGGPDESAMQPRWLGDKLIFASDRTNWWNLYVWSGQDGLQALCTIQAEFCLPQWSLGSRPYAIIDDDHLLCTLNRSGERSIEILRISDGALRAIAAADVAAASVDVGGECAAALLSYPDRPAAVALYGLASSTWTTVNPPAR